MSKESGIEIGCLPMLFIIFLIFLILKLTNVIAWSWWWVCSPIIVYVVWTIIWWCFIMGLLGFALGLKISKKYGL